MKRLEIYVNHFNKINSFINDSKLKLFKNIIIKNDYNFYLEKI